MPILTKEEIMAVIPHREPFLLIDEVLELEPGVRCVAVKTMREDEFWFRGHFPGMPVTPGVLMVEMLAQTAGVCVGSLPENKGKIGLFAKISEAKFRRMVAPGDVLTLEVEITKLKASVVVAEGLAHVGGERAVSCGLTFAYAGQRG